MFYESGVDVPMEPAILAIVAIPGVDGVLVVLGFDVFGAALRAGEFLRAADAAARNDRQLLFGQLDALFFGKTHERLMVFAGPDLGDLLFGQPF